MAIAKQVIADAAQQGLMLAQVEISSGISGEPEIKTVARTGGTANRKTLKQSMVDAICEAARQRLGPEPYGGGRDYWLDEETGAEWRGSEVGRVRTEILYKLDEWVKTV